ncbi:hypothetical protein B2A_09849 [mine drainage metagenome]|uniref:Uncharacterized protein n=1 Tax=mine drainage metagenome TaxID=410659 RepID=T1AS34_9ZZZZ
MKENKWSDTEKRNARRIFNKTLQMEYNLIIEKTRDLAVKATSQQDLWEIHSYLTNSLKEINRKYDYRYSRIIQLFGELLAEGKISERELDVFSTDKAEQIRNIANFMKSAKMEGEA